MVMLTWLLGCRVNEPANPIGRALSMGRSHHPRHSSVPGGREAAGYVPVAAGT